MNSEDLKTILDLRTEVSRLKTQVEELEEGMRKILFHTEQDARQEQIRWRMKWYKEGKASQFHRDEEDDFFTSLDEL